MSNKVKVLIVAAVALVCFAVGRYTAPSKVTVQTKVVEVDHKVDDSDTKTHEHKKVVIVTKPDGTSVTTITDSTNSDTKDHSVDISTTTTNQTTTTDKSKNFNNLTVYALAGSNLLHGGAITYGAMVTKPLLGPVFMGLFGMTNLTCGASIGLTF